MDIVLGWLKFQIFLGCLKFLIFLGGGGGERKMLDPSIRMKKKREYPPGVGMLRSVIFLLDVINNIHLSK